MAEFDHARDGEPLAWEEDEDDKAKDDTEGE